MYPFDLTGKNILITGASSGIGRAVAIECSKLGAQLIVTGRDNERLQETLNSLAGNNHQAILCNLIEFDKLEELVRSIQTIDGLVLSAGINDKTLTKSISAEKIDKMFSINLYSPMFLIKELLKKKKLNVNASVVAISSVSSSYSTISNALYAASKGALESFMRVLALEVAPRRIRVNAIKPAAVETPIIASYKLADEMELFKKQIPLGRFGKPEEIAYGAIYLLSDAAAWITGTILTIDGGLTLR